MPRQEAGEARSGRAGGWFTREEIERSREPSAGGIQQRRRENVSFLETRYLLAKVFRIGAVRIVAEGREVIAIVDGIDNAQSVFLGKDMVEPRRSEIIPNDLQGVVERLRNP